jgi:hypothetical protein
MIVQQKSSLGRISFENAEKNCVRNLKENMKTGLNKSLT